MAKELTPEEKAAQEEKKRLQEEKKKLKKEQAAQKKEAKKRAKEIAKQEEELEADEEGGGFVTFIATVFIVLLWLVVAIVMIKIDVGGFGSSVLAPVLKDVPVINKILPSSAVSETLDPQMYGGYTNLQDAVNRIYALETELDAVKNASVTKDDRITALEAEVTRLSEFETMQVDFQRPGSRGVRKILRVHGSHYRRISLQTGHSGTAGFPGDSGLRQCLLQYETQAGSRSF